MNTVRITGTLVTYAETAPLTMMGRPVRCLPGSILIPAATLDVLLEHAGPAVGVVVDLDVDEVRIRVVVDVDPDEVPDGVKGFSPGLDIRVGYLSEDGTVYLVESAVLTEASLTERPAFPGSLLDGAQ